jgi:L-2-hydroxyglutarate oxidase LhgO
VRVFVCLCVCIIRVLINRQIYPVPNPAFPFLGTHITPRMDGQVAGELCFFGQFESSTQMLLLRFGWVQML